MDCLRLEIRSYSLPHQVSHSSPELWSRVALQHLHFPRHHQNRRTSQTSVAPASHQRQALTSRKPWQPLLCFRRHQRLALVSRTSQGAGMRMSQRFGRHQHHLVALALVALHRSGQSNSPETVRLQVQRVLTLIVWRRVRILGWRQHQRQSCCFQTHSSP